MKIFETVRSPATNERMFFSKDNMTLYTSKEVIEAYWQQAMDVLSRTGEVTIEVNATTLSHKFKKDERTPRNKRGKR